MRDAACTVCNEPTTYTGRLPILCQSCRDIREQIATDGGAAQLLGTTNLLPRLFLPDSELMPKPVIG